MTMPIIEISKSISISVVVFLFVFGIILKLFIYWEMLSIKEILERLDLDLYDKYMRLRYNTKQIEKALEEQNKEDLCQSTKTHLQQD